MPVIGKPPYRRGSKKTTDMSVGILNGIPSIQVNWGGRIYGTPLSLLGAGNVKDSLNISDLKVSGNVTFGRNSFVYNNSNRILLVGGLTGAGDKNFAIGTEDSLSSIVKDSNNITNLAIGQSALASMINGQTNVAIGEQAMRYVGQHASDGYADNYSNVAVGTQAMMGHGDSTRTQGLGNVALGYGAMQYIHRKNTAANPTTGNICIGVLSGQNCSGNYNVYLGYNTAEGGTATHTGVNNIAVGYNSFSAITTGDYNIIMGSVSGATITAGSKNILLGFENDVQEDGSNRVALGNSITVNDDNTTVIGNTNIILDAVGDITLDADGDNIKMLAGSDGSGLDFIQSGTGDYTIKNLTSDKDVIFNVNDGTVDTEVMRLDGSRSSLFMAASKQISFGDAGEKIYGNGTNMFINSSNNMSLQAEQFYVTVSDAGEGFKITQANVIIADDTSKALHLDLDSTGVIADGETLTNLGLDIDINTDSPTMVGTVNNTGIDIDMVAGTSGTQTNTGIDILCDVSDDGTGIKLDVTGGTTSTGIYIDNKDGGQDFHNVSSADSADYFSISTGTAGATTISTVDSDDGEEAHLTLDIQGDTIFKGDIADGTATEVCRIDSSASSILMESSKKIEFASSINFIHASGASDMTWETDRHILLNAGGVVFIDASSHIEIDSSVGFDKPSNYVDDTNVTVDFRESNKAHLDMTGGNISGTLTLQFPAVSGNFLLVVQQDGSTRTIAAYATKDTAGNAGDNDGGTAGEIRWAGGSLPDLSDGGNLRDILSFYWDADEEVCYGVASLAFAAP